MSNAPQSIKRRRVHYFSGFDPRGPAHYHRLCRDEAGRPQPQGGVLHVARREKVSRVISRWQVRWRASAGAAESVQTEHVFMSWDDVIRAHWSRSPWALLREFWLTYRGIVFDVDLRRVTALYGNAFKTGVLPAIFLLGTLVLGMLAGLGGSLAMGAWGWLAALPVMAGLWSYGAHKGLFWLLRTFHFVIRMGSGPVTGVQERTRVWVDHIVARQQQDPVDEVLLAGHSVGTLMVLYAMDMLLHDERWIALQKGKPTGMVTLGQCCPSVALVPGATDFREMLLRLCRHPHLQWLDVSARIDPLCFHNTHPLALSGVPHADLPLPVRHNARFFQMYEPARWATIRSNKLHAHFLYLMTPDKPGNFHLCDLFYGTRPLEAHMQGRAES